MYTDRRFYKAQLTVLAGLIGLMLAVFASAQETRVAKKGDDHAMDMHKTGMFAGAKANMGFAMHRLVEGKNTLMLSDDFVTPDTPAPHWQVVDSEGNVYLLNRLMIKGDKFNKSITLPAYIHDVAKVQIWCAWAEALLGEASFEKPVK